MRFESVLTHGLLIRDAEGVVWYPAQAGGAPRPALLVAARAAAKEGIVKGGKPTPDAYIAHLPEAVREMETAVRAHMGSEAVTEAVTLAVTEAPYETRSGPLADRAQVAVTYLGTLNTTQAFDAVVRRLFA